MAETTLEKQLRRSAEAGSGLRLNRRRLLERDLEEKQKAALERLCEWCRLLRYSYDAKGQLLEGDKQAINAAERDLLLAAQAEDEARLAFGRHQLENPEARDE